MYKHTLRYQYRCLDSNIPWATWCHLHLPAGIETLENNLLHRWVFWWARLIVIVSKENILSSKSVNTRNGSNFPKSNYYIEREPKDVYTISRLNSCSINSSCSIRNSSCSNSSSSGSVVAASGVAALLLFNWVELWAATVSRWVLMEKHLVKTLWHLIKIVVITSNITLLIPQIRCSAMFIIVIG